ncbi:hypothetical protein BJF93_02730 [Xaviernesmea oryzae]|uniref:Antitoxin n=1 Tax=Xaviernesmea oryzae TaxID=464029 RepID=A0A1Q9AZ72_9HYPH|nr:hypothetical protein [Xaviernesmea oryzae]OLP60996.1 hypothetical protein BJF93_02730 [Xaviernesmea oryzae]SEL18148.1 Antitoxin component of toxin-antitoxin stability system, DNA-binding transcriptional repressor [Xaviernesmea oryzae]
MRISIEQAAGQLTELVRLAEEGEDIVLTENGEARVRLQTVSGFNPDKDLRLKLIEDIQERVRQKNLPPGPDAAHSQDFLYDEDGLPA